MIKLLRFLRPFRKQVAMTAILVFLQAVANLYLPTLMARIVDTGIVKGDTDYILTTGAYMLLITFGGALCSVGSSFLASRTAVGFARQIRSKLFSHIQRFSLHEFDRVSSASLITRTTNDTMQVQMFLTMALTLMLLAPTTLIGGIILAVSENATLALTLVGIIPAVVLIFWAVIRKAIPLFRSIQKKIDRLNLVIDEGLTGVRVIRAFDRLAYEKERFDDANLDLTNTAIKVNRIVAFMMPVMMLIMNYSTLGIFWFGGLLIDSGDLQVGSMMAFIQYAIQILFSIVMVTMTFAMLPRASASADRINEVLAIAPAISDPERAIRADGRRGHVEFRDVTFSYPSMERPDCGEVPGDGRPRTTESTQSHMPEEPAVSHISFTAAPGQTTAIIGGTGSGKTSLINLIPRFYDVDCGQVLIDGVDVREMSLDDLRAKIGFVPQKAVLFSGSVTDNIKYGNPHASEAEVRHAAEVAQAAEFIAEMPSEYDAEISQGGTNISGGQKQRLSIARALVRRPEIYVFDDSFSALDFATDAKLRAALRKETRDSTVLIVAQRVGTVLNADQIIVLDEGRIAGIGTHRELMKSCEVYREIVSSQLSLEEIA